MAEKNRTVSVLTPNGRRPNIKVSINTTILEVLEEVCQKYEFNADEYDLKHYNQILDVSKTIGYAKLSNKASLEMVRCKTPRKVSNITICVQPECGNRVTGEFSPNENLDKILKELKIEYNKDSAVIIYTRREILGKDFEAVTLKSLGLGNGKALFRLIHRDLEKLKEQAHVYVPSTPKVPKTEDNEDNRPRPRSTVDHTKNKVIDPVDIIRAEKKCMNIQDDVKKEKDSENKSKGNDEVEKELHSTDLTKEEETPMEVDNTCKIETNENIEKIVETEPQIEFLGERNALLYHRADARAVAREDIPDSFFEVTADDVKRLLKNAQAKNEESPLTTAAYKELEKDKEKLNLLHKYQQAVIRIQFPNSFVLQGLFAPLEKIQTVKDFVQTYLEHPETDFTLFTTPPRTNLNPEERLIDLNLVPSSIVYYSGSSDLRPDIKLKLTDPEAASAHVAQTRQTFTRPDRVVMDGDDEVVPSTSETTSRVIDNGSVEQQPGPSRAYTRPKTEPSKVPKWFKISKK